MGRNQSDECRGTYQMESMERNKDGSIQPKGILPVQIGVYDLFSFDVYFQFF